MKSIFLISILLVILCSAANAMTVTGGMFRDPSNPGMCTLNNNMILREGEVSKKPNGQCAHLMCYANGHVSMMACVKQGMRPGCTEGKYLFPDADYPECCKREIKCQTHYYSDNF